MGARLVKIPAPRLLELDVMLLASGVKSTRFAFAACQAAVHGDMVTQKYIEDHRKVWKVNIHVLDAE